MKNLTLLFISFFFFFNLKSGQACSCYQIEKIDIWQYNTYDLIFKGEILSVELNKNHFYKRVKVKVKKNYKNSNLDKVITIHTARDGAACGVSFAEGEEWLIYGDIYEGKFRTNLCTRTTRLTKKKNKALCKEMRYLKKHKRKTGFVKSDVGKGKLKKGKPIGKWTYFRDGKVWKIYNYSKEGKVQSIMEYKNGKLINTISYDKDD